MKWFIIGMIIFVFLVWLLSPKPKAHANCYDGTISYSQHRSGTCSGHDGVKNWLY